MKKTILITGASSGIGKETALYFANNNWTVIATMISLDLADDLVTIPNVFCYELDVTSSESITKAKDKILNDHKTINVVLNNAGLGYRSFVELSEDNKIDNIVNVNWLGAVKVCRAFIPVFREQNFGQFITISSIAGLVNLPLGSFYHSTKQAVESFSECMAYELLDFNISVSTVQFGNAPTSFQANVTKCCATPIDSYNKLMEKVTAILQKKTKKNTNLTPIITKTLFNIAENPKKKFKRYTIGFDAHFMSFIRRLLGYKLFNSLIRKSVFRTFLILYHLKINNLKRNTMKLVILALSFVMLTSFGTLEEVSLNKTSNSEVVIGESFSLINDSKDKISIYTGTGFVSLNKGSKTSIGCNVGKEVCWANEGKKGDVIFKITADMCGKTLKLSELMK